MTGPADPTVLRCRQYGTGGPLILVLHGGPGAPGHMAPVARELGRWFRVLEPFQRRSGVEPLTVARHVEDLRELVARNRATDGRPALVGSSWGAMLALAFAAAHPGLAGPLVLIGCGTFDPAARARMRAILASRMTPELEEQLELLEEQGEDPDRQLERRGQLIHQLYAFRPVGEEDEDRGEPCDGPGHQETWGDMVRLQEEGIYPAAFAAIESPVLMLHGTHDPHPGELIRQSLAPYLRRLEYHALEQCGHYPWQELEVREQFFALLRRWLEQQLIHDAMSHPEETAR